MPEDPPSPGGPPDAPSPPGAETSAPEHEAWMRAYLATAVDGIITIDAGGIMRSVNPSAERLFGYRAEEMVGRNVSILMPDPWRREHDGYLANYLRGGEARIIGIGREVVGARRDGTTFPAFLSVSEVRVGDRVLFAGSVRDLTDLRRAEEEAARSRTLAAIGEMSASIAHEIKNPLAAISGVLQNLRDRLPAGDPARGLMEQALGEVRRLDASIRDLLQFSRSWNPRRRETDLRAIVERVVAATEGVALYRGIRFAVEGPERVPMSADRSMLEQVFLNLFQNAAEASGGAGTVLCTLALSPSGVTAVVEDDGPGIPPETMATLFRPFYTTKKGGTGLGLANCLKMVEAHGGTVSVGARAPRGTRVALRFPRQAEPPPGDGEGTAGRRVSSEP